MPNNSFGYDDRLPTDIRDIFMWLCQDVAALHQKWEFYKALFSASNLSLLSTMAVGSFNILEETLRDSMTMAISRLSDPSQSRYQDNLTMERLTGLQSDIPNLIALVTEFQKLCQPIRDIRNKLTGHKDLNATLQPNNYPVPGISSEQVDKMVTMAEQILMTVYRKYTNGDLRFEGIWEGGADTLVFWLKLAYEHKDDDKAFMRKE